MTVIAYDGHTVAADKQATNGDYRATVTKLHRVGHEVLAFCGHADVGLAMVAWYRAGCPVDQFPNKGLSNEDATWLYVFAPGARVRCYQRQPIPIIFEDPLFAAGSGCAVAKGALLAGADARRAVEIACQVLDGCGMGVDAEDLVGERVAAAS